MLSSCHTRLAGARCVLILSVSTLMQHAATLKSSCGLSCTTESKTCSTILPCHEDQGTCAQEHCSEVGVLTSRLPAVRYLATCGTAPVTALADASTWSTCKVRGKRSNTSRLAGQPSATCARNRRSRTAQACKRSTLGTYGRGHDD